jgi:hypothetical protein
MALVLRVVMEDEAGYCDDRLADDACSDAHYNARYSDARCYNDARYDTHLNDAAMADVVVPADVAVAVRMHTFLQAGINMRICIFS